MSVCRSFEDIVLLSVRLQSKTKVVLSEQVKVLFPPRWQQLGRNAGQLVASVVRIITFSDVKNGQFHGVFLFHFLQINETSVARQQAAVAAAEAAAKQSSGIESRFPKLLQ